MNRFPKKLLRITDLTFVLPDDFNGDFLDALNILTNYVNNRNSFDNVEDKNTSTVESLLNDNTSKLCMKFGIFEADEDNNYKLK